MRDYLIWKYDVLHTNVKVAVGFYLCTIEKLLKISTWATMKECVRIDCNLV